MVVVADPILEPGRGSRRLNPPDKTFGNEECQRVVYRLRRDGADLGPHDLRRAVGGNVGVTRDCPKNSQPLGGDLYSALTKEIGWIGCHSLIE